MRFYTNKHPFYCGIDLHARSLYVCILNDDGQTVLHKEIKAKPDPLLNLLNPFLGNVVLGVECMHCWYWISDFCHEHNIDFILGHAPYMKAIHGGKAKTDRIDSYKIAHLIRGGNFPLAYVYPAEMRATCDLLRRRTRIVRHGADLKAHVKNTTSQYNLHPNKLNLRYPAAREQMRDRFADESVQKNIDLDLNIIEFYHRQLSAIECYIEKHVKHHNGRDYHILTSVPGMGRILALTILYEIGDITRFDSIQKFASYSRLIKCRAESAGKVYGTQGNKIGNAHLRWAFGEIAVGYLRGNEKAQSYLARLHKRMGKAKALTALAHKLSRCVYFMLKNQQVFDEQRFLTG